MVLQAVLIACFVPLSPPCRPAWQLAAAVAAQPTCSGSARQQLLVFALTAAPAEQLMPLLQQWQAADDAAAGEDSAGCWALFSAAAEPSSSSGWQEQQQWLAQQLKLYFSGISGSRAGSSEDGEAAALGCLLALGQRGLQQWEQLLVGQQQRPLTHQQRRRALLLGLTAGALLALQPADLDPAAAATAVAAAEARLAASPSELLSLLQQQQQQSSQAQPQATPAAGNAESAVAAEAAARFHDLLVSAVDAQQLQRLLPGVDAAAALAGGAGSRRRLVLHLAVEAGKPSALQTAAAAAAAATGGSSSPASSPLPSPARRLGVGASSSGGGSAGDSGSMLQRAVSRKKSEAAGAGAAADSSADSPSPVSRQQQLDAEAAGEMLRQALLLAGKSGVAAWEVHLALAESLLLHNPQQQWQQQPGVPARQLLEASLPPLLAGKQQAAALLDALLSSVWPSARSRWPQHLFCCLQLMQRCAAALAAAAGVERDVEQWQEAASAFAACAGAAEQLLQGAGGIDAKLFLQPVAALLAASSSRSSSSNDSTLLEPVSAAALNQQLLQNVANSNAPQLAAALEQLQRQHSAAAAAAATAVAAFGGDSSSYPCSSNIVFLALFCKSITQQQGSRRGELPHVVQALAAWLVGLYWWMLWMQLQPQQHPLHTILDTHSRAPLSSVLPCRWS